MLEARKPVTMDPENSETPLAEVHSWVTPNRLFFVRNHFELPQIDLATWRLALEGCIDRPAEWTWEQLAELPQRSVFATIECAGNGRSFLQTPVAGVQWGAGAIGHAEWTGVPLHTLLADAGVRPEALEVVFEAADRGSESDHPEPMPFARSLSLEKAMDPDTLLALRMNGERLEPIHGFPVRLLVPGWYGVASVKWLQRITVVDEPFRGYYQTAKYTVLRQSAGSEQTEVVGPMVVKSEILRPRVDEVLGIGTNRIFGVAWAGEQAVAEVQVATDGGATWQPAELLGPRTPYSWCLWEYLWEVADAGRYEIAARAVSAGGHAQPDGHDPLLGGYMINFIRPRRVRVDAERRSTARPADAQTLLYDMNAFAEQNTRFPLDVEMEFTGGAGI
jgi:DMSO/TMAO reductase YedYZ molybdopterin-dependent catalytic subunit